MSEDTDRLPVLCAGREFPLLDGLDRPFIQAEAEGPENSDVVSFAIFPNLQFKKNYTLEVGFFGLFRIPGFPLADQPGALHSLNH